MLSRSTPFEQFKELSSDDQLDLLTNNLIEAGKAGIGIGGKKKNKSYQLPKELRLKIAKKNTLARDLDSLTGSGGRRGELEMALRGMKEEISADFSSIKMRRRAKIRNKILRKDPHKKKFWKFIKSHVASAGAITGLYSEDGGMVFDQAKIEEIILGHFSQIFKAQRMPIYPMTNAQDDMVSLAIGDIDDYLVHRFTETAHEEEVCTPYTADELAHCLDSLPNEKACGIDGIPNEFLRNSGKVFQQYLLNFLNKIIDNGEVPEKLNTGKCFLIHKVT